MRPVSESTSRVVEHNCSKKYIALGRIVQQWADIIGKDLALVAQPARIHYRRKDGQKDPQAILEIATTPSQATALHYRKDLILQKINYIFGDGWVTGIKFTSVQSLKKTPLLKRPIRPASPADKAAIGTILQGIADEDIKIRLEKLGEAVINTST